MPTKKQPKQKAPRFTREVLPVITDAGSIQFTVDDRSYDLTMTLSVTDDPLIAKTETLVIDVAQMTMMGSVTDDPEQAERWSRSILWTHQESDLNARRYDGPQRVTGWFCPATFVLRGAGSRIEFTLDVPDVWRRTIDGQPLTLEQHSRKSQPMPDPIPEIIEVRNLKRSDGLRSPIKFPASFTGHLLNVVTEKALRLALVVAQATPPGPENDSGKWRYQITEYCQGTIDDVPKRSRVHHHPAMSPEGLRQVWELFDESKRASKKRGNGARVEYERIGNLIGRRWTTVREQVNELYRQGLLPRKDQK